MRSCKFKISAAMLAFSVGIAAFFVWDRLKLFPEVIQPELAGKSHSGNVILQISSEKTSVKVGEELSLKVTLKNNDGDVVTLVSPGDGSEHGWRTPVVQWSVIEAGDSLRRHPREPVLTVRPRCGNVNPLTAQEIFPLAPGETKELSWTYLPPFREPGVYKVVFLYANRPSLRWRFEDQPAYHDSTALGRAKRSTEVNLASNEIIFTVDE